MEFCSFLFATDICSNESTKTFYYEESLTRQKIKQLYWSSFITRMNIADEKKFINIWQTDINDEIFIKTVKSTLLIMNHVSCVLSIEKKKTFHLTWISSLFQKRNIDCVYLLQSRLMKTLIIIKNNLIEWMKARVLFNLEAKNVTKFL